MASAMAIDKGEAAARIARLFPRVQRQSFAVSREHFPHGEEMGKAASDLPI